MENRPAYYKARIALIDKLLRQTPDTDEKNNALVLLRNGIISGKLLHGQSEEKAIQEMIEKGNYSNTPLTFSELCRWNTWFVMHPEKVAGTEIISTSREFPITIKGTKEDIFEVLTPITENILYEYPEITAEKLGEKAFNAGKKRIFSHDKEALKLLEGRKVGDKLNTEIMNAWYKGWDKANLAAPVPEKNHALALAEAEAEAEMEMLELLTI